MGLILIFCFLFMAGIVDEDTNPGGIVYGVCVHACVRGVCVCVCVCLPPMHGASPQ